MATAQALINGFKYEILNGDFAGEVVTILDKQPVPDGQPNQRKVRVETPDGKDYYILPRQLKDSPVGIQLPEPESAPVVPTFSMALPVAEEQVISERLADGTNVVRTLRVLRPITDPMDPRLDHLRPKVRKVKQYESREMADGLSDTDFLLTFTGDDHRNDPNNQGRPASIMLKGDTQSGKTMLVEVLACLWADRLGYPKPMPIYTISGSAGVTDYDMFGQTTSYTDPEGNNTLVWLPGMVELAAQVGGILYIDEANAIDPRYTSSLHPLIDHRHSFTNRNKAVWKDGQFMAEVTYASMDLWVVSTINEAYAGMGKMNEAFINRFEPIVWGYDAKVEAKLINSAAIRLLGDALRTARERNSIRTPIGTAALQRAERNVSSFGPALGMFILTSLFNPQERPVVESIIEDRSIVILLNEELRQREVEDAARATV